MDAQLFLAALKERGYGPVVHVPCSSLGALIAAAERDPELEVMNPANEAIALGLASGAFLAGKKPVVLIQNSGLLNTLNGLTSLNQIYGIPVLLMVSWRGFGKDAPEHELVGRDLEQYLRTFGLAYAILADGTATGQLAEADRYLKERSQPYVLLVKPDLFGEHKNAATPSAYPLERFEAIKLVKQALAAAGCHFISTNGFISRESYETSPSDDFYMMGSMGHALPLGLGAAKYTDKKIAVLDGDGAVLMHLGALASVAAQQPKNLLHVVFDNEAYASTGGQPTLSGRVRLDELAKNCGYRNVFFAADRTSLAASLERLAAGEGPSLLLIKVRPGNAKGIKRVSDEMTCPEIRDRFMRGLA